MTEQLQQYLEVSGRVTAQLRLLQEIEQEKRAALLDHDTDRLAEVLRGQQAQVMQLEILEKKRLSTQLDAGLEGLTGKEILEGLPEPDRAAAQTVFTELGRATRELQELNRIAMEIAETELKLIERLTSASTETPSGLYTAGGKKGTGRGQGAAFEEKI